MKREKDILYQIKTLDKMIFRKLCSSEDMLKAKNAIINRTMTPTQMQIIEYILEHDASSIYQKDLEKVLKLRRATVSGVLQTMEKNGLIERIVDEKDTRVKKIILNDKKKNIFYEKLEKIKIIENIIKRDISQEELDIFFGVILKMQSNIQREEENEKVN